MGRPEAYLAFDTSAYTTSVAAIADGRLLFDGRTMLKVPMGSRGLRQSEAVFEHIKNLRELLQEEAFDGFEIRGVAFSEKPCPIEGSYMPVFCVGASHAAAFSAACHAPLFALTHQHGHIYAAFLGQDVPDGEYLVFHVSGGTLDILRVRIDNGIVEQIQPMGGTLDVTCGQLIDRVGVKAGLPFPSGVAIEAIYQPGSAPLAVHVDGLGANLSGAETQAMRRLEAGEEPAKVCSAVIDCTAATLGQLVINAGKVANSRDFLFTGGVMRNGIIRDYIDNICTKSGYTSRFAQKQYCSDNACGLALAAQRLLDKGD